MKCSIKLHFIWVCTVCQSIGLGVSRIQRVNIPTFPILLFLQVAYGIWKEVKRTNKDTSACTDTSTYTEESELKANVLCLCDVAKYSGEWPQLAEIKEIKGNRALIQWYKGSKTTSWNPCTKRVKTGAKWEPWVEDIKISDIWCSGFELTGAKKLPQKIKEKVDNYHTTLKQDKIKTELE